MDENRTPINSSTGKSGCPSFVPVQRCKCEERLVAQSGQYSAFQHLNSGFDLGFILWFPYPCWYHGYLVMFCQILIDGINGWLIPVRRFHSGFQVIRLQYCVRHRYTQMLVCVSRSSQAGTESGQFQRRYSSRHQGWR